MRSPISNTEYWVLDKYKDKDTVEDNIEVLMKLTGKPEKELREMYEESVKFGWTYVFWRSSLLPRLWNSIKVSDEYVIYGAFDDVLEEAIFQAAKR